LSDLETKLAELRTRVASLEAQTAIRELATEYAVACDVHDMDGLTDLFTEDAEFDSPAGVMVATGRDTIAAMFVELFKIRGPAFHWTHDVMVQVSADNPNEATGRVYSHAETTPNGLVSLAAMRYDDNYRYEEGRWRFARRSISFLYYVPASDYANGLNQTNRVTFGDHRGPADYPEALPSWQKFLADWGSS